MLETLLININIIDINGNPGQYEIRYEYEKSSRFDSSFEYEGKIYNIHCFKQNFTRTVKTVHNSGTNQRTDTLPGHCVFAQSEFNQTFSLLSSPSSLIDDEYFFSPPSFYPVYKSSYHLVPNEQDDYLCAVRMTSISLFGSFHNHRLGYSPYFSYPIIYRDYFYIPTGSSENVIYNTNFSSLLLNESRSSQLQIPVSKIFHSFRDGRTLALNIPSSIYRNTQFLSSNYPFNLPSSSPPFRINFSHRVNSYSGFAQISSETLFNEAQPLGNICDGFYPSP